MSASKPSLDPRDELRGRVGRALTGLRRAVLNPASGVGVSAERFWLTLLLLGLCQTADLLTFNLAVRQFGISGELGPLGLAYRFGGIAAVTFLKLGGIFVVMGILRWYPWQRLATRRRLAIVIATIGLVGALTNLLAWF